MKIKLNGALLDTLCVTLEELVQSENHQTDAVATALNGEFIPKDQRADTRLFENDAVEIIAPMSGG